MTRAINENQQTELIIMGRNNKKRILEVWNHDKKVVKLNGLCFTVNRLVRALRQNPKSTKSNR